MTVTLRADSESNHPEARPTACAPFDPTGLVERLRAGDPVAPAELLAQYGAGLLAAARSIVGDEHAAMDAVQDGVVAAIRAIDTLQEPRALGGWLRQIVTNAALLHMRKRRRRRERPIEDLLPTFGADGHRANPAASWVDEVDDQMDRSALLRRVRDAIEELPAHYREVLTLRDVMGLSTNVAAETLSITPNHVKVRLHRARMALRTLLQERLGDACPR